MYLASVKLNEMRLHAVARTRTSTACKRVFLIHANAKRIYLVADLYCMMELAYFSDFLGGAFQWHHLYRLNCQHQLWD